MLHICLHRITSIVFAMDRLTIVQLVINKTYYSHTDICTYSLAMSGGER